MEWYVTDKKVQKQTLPVHLSNRMRLSNLSRNFSHPTYHVFTLLPSERRSGSLNLTSRYKLPSSVIKLYFFFLPLTCRVILFWEKCSWFTGSASNSFIIILVLLLFAVINVCVYIILCFLCVWDPQEKKLFHCTRRNRYTAENDGPTHLQCNIFILHKLQNRKTYKVTGATRALSLHCLYTASFARRAGGDFGPVLSWTKKIYYI